MPSCNGRKVGGVKLARVDDGVTTVNAKGRVLVLSGERVQASRLLLAVGEPYAQRLRNEQQIRNLAPRIRIDLRGQVLRHIAGTQFYPMSALNRNAFKK